MKITGWQLLTIDDVTSKVQYGYTTKASSEGSVKFLRTTDITSGNLNWNTVPYCATPPDDVNKYLLNENDILISRAGSVGYSYLVKKTEPAVFASYLIRFVPKINPQYMAYFLQTSEYWSQISEKKLGIAVQNVNATKLKTIKIPVPDSTKVQDKIVAKIEEHLSQLDQARLNLEKSHDLTKAYRQSVLKKAFSGALTEKDRKTYRLKEILKTIDGDRGPNYPKKSDFQSQGYCLFLSTKNVRKYGFLFENNIFINKEKHAQLRNGTLERGDLVITTRGTLGNVAIYDDKVSYDVVRINSGMLILRPDNKLIDTTFLSNFLFSPQFSVQLEQKRSGTAQPQIPAGVLKKIEIELPDLAGQQMVNEFIDQQMTIVAQQLLDIEKSIKKIDNLKKSILSKAFKGELV